MQEAEDEGVWGLVEHSTLNPQPPTLNPEPSILNPQSSTLNPRSSTLYPQASSLKPQLADLAVKEAEDEGVGGLVDDRFDARERIKTPNPKHNTQPSALNA